MDNDQTLAAFQASYAGCTVSADGEATLKLKIPSSDWKYIKDLPESARERPLLISVFAQQTSMID